MPLATLERHIQTSEKSLFAEIKEKEEQMELARKAKTGDKKACAHLILSMTRLILKRINAKIQTFNDEEVIADLLSDCYMVLIGVFYSSSAKFDPTRDAKPSTCAVWWIDDTMGRRLHETSSLIRLPQNIKWSAIRFAKENHGAEFNVTNSMVADFAKRHKIRPKTLIAALKAYDVMCLDAPIDDSHEETTMVSGITDETFSPERVVSKELRDSSIKKIISEAMVLGLSQREAHIIRDRYGLNPSGKIRGSEEIAKLHKISRQRVYQIEKESLEKMKKWLESHPEYGRLVGQLEAATCS